VVMYYHQLKFKELYEHGEAATFDSSLFRIR
jgi:hypothetical protein